MGGGKEGWRTAGLVSQGLIHPADARLVGLAAVQALDHPRAGQHGAIASSTRRERDDGRPPARPAMPAIMPALPSVTLLVPPLPPLRLRRPAPPTLKPPVDAVQPFPQRLGRFPVPFGHITSLLGRDPRRLPHERTRRTGRVHGAVGRAGGTAGGGGCGGGQGQTGEQQARGQRGHGRHGAAVRRPKKEEGCLPRRRTGMTPLINRSPRGLRHGDRELMLLPVI